MDIISKNGLKYLSFNENAHVLAGVSTRIGGYSTGEYSELNVGINTKDDKESIKRNREHLFNTIAPNMQVCHLNQTHSALIQDVDNHEYEVFCNGDGLITTERNKLLCITIADCGSVLFHDDEFTVACAIHCGWRGTRDGIVGEALRLLAQWTDLSNIHAYIGPMIRQPSYEVGKEFTTMFNSAFFSEKGGKLTFDLNAFIINTLSRAGITSISDCGYDTFQSSELFFSHRRYASTGRMCAFIGLK